VSGNAGTGQVAIEPTFVGFRSKVTSEVDTTGAESGNRFTAAFGNGVKGLGSLVGKSILAAGAITAAVGAIAVKGGISRQLQIEDATAKLDGLGNSADDVKSIMNNALASVKGTAFGMGEAATVAAGATAAGIKPGVQLERILKLTGDAATIAGTSMGEMGGIFNKVASTGKLTGDVVAQLQDRGFPILQMVADKYGVTAAAASEMVSKGKVDFADFAEAIEKNVGGAALKSGNTTKGAWANMLAGLSRVGVTLSGGFFPLVKDVFNQVTTILDGVNAKIKPTAEAFGIWFQGRAGPAIAGFSATALTHFDRIYDGASRLWAGLSMGTLTRLEFSGQLTGLVAFGAGLRSVVDEVVGGFRAFHASWVANDGDVTSSGFPGFMERAAFFSHQLVDALQLLDFTSFDGFIASLSVAGGSAGAAFGSIGTSLQALAPAFREFGAQLPNISGAVVKLAGVGLSVLVNVLGFLADHVDTIIFFMPLIVAGFVAWRIASMGAHASMVLTNIAQAAMVPLTTVNNVLRLQAIKLEREQAIAMGQRAAMTNTQVLGTIRGTAAMVAQNIAMGASKVAMGLATAAQWAWNVAMNANPIALIILGIVALIAIVVLLVANWESVVGFFKGIWDGIVAGVSWFVGFVGGLFLQFHPVGLIISHWGEIVGFFKGIWDNVLAGIGGFVSGAADFFVGLPAQILAALAGAGQWLLEVGHNILVGLATGIAVGVVAIHYLFTRFPSDLVGWLVGAGTWLAQTGTDLLVGLGVGIVLGYMAVSQFFTELPGKVLGFLVMAGTWLLQTGTDVLVGMALGITAGYLQVSQFFTDLPGVVLGLLAMAGVWLLTTGTDILTGLFNGIVAGFVTVVGFYVALPGRILGFLAGAGAWLLSTGSSLIGGFLSGITGAWSGLMGWFGSIPGMITGALSGAGSWLVGTGTNIIDGLLTGLRNAGNTIGSFFLGLLPDWIVGPFKAALGIASPSKVFAGFGENIGQGVIVGANRTRADIERTMASLVSTPPAQSIAINTAQAGARARAATEAAAGTTVNFNGPVYGDPDHIVDAMDAKKRRASTRSNLKLITAGG